MKAWNVITQKTIALVLATFIFSLPLTSIAAAKDRHDAPPPPRQEERHDRPERKDPPKPPKEEPRHDRDDRRHDAPPPLTKDPRDNSWVFLLCLYTAFIDFYDAYAGRTIHHE